MPGSRDTSETNDLQAVRDITTKPKVDQDLKLYQIVQSDLAACQRYLIAYIELMTPREAETADPWLNLESREYEGDHNFLDILARSLVTSIVISYGRPWSNNRSPAGKVRLSKKVFLDMSQQFRRGDPEERLLPFDHGVHDQVLDARDKIIAHSDLSEWPFSIDRTSNRIETRSRDPFSFLSLEDARTLLRNTQSLRAQLNEYRRKALEHVKSNP